MSEYVVYLGDMEGEFSLNSRALQGHKYRVQKDRPFKLISNDDMWIASMRGYRVLSLINFTPIIKRIPLLDESYLPKWDAAFLEGLVAALPDPARVIEIGTGKGNSLVRILYGLALHEDVIVWSIDLEEKKEAQQYVEKAEVPNWRYRMVVSDSVLYAHKFTHDVDFIYVDGSHSYDGVTRDIAAWEPKLKVGGVMCFDDYGDPLHEVTYAVDEAMFTEGWRLIGAVGVLIAFEKVEGNQE